MRRLRADWPRHVLTEVLLPPVGRGRIPGLSQLSRVLVTRSQRHHRTEGSTSRLTCANGRSMVGHLRRVLASVFRGNWRDTAWE